MGDLSSDQHASNAMPGPARKPMPGQQPAPVHTAARQQAAGHSSGNDLNAWDTLVPIQELPQPCIMQAGSQQVMPAGGPGVLEATSGALKASTMHDSGSASACGIVHHVVGCQLTNGWTYEGGMDSDSRPHGQVGEVAVVLY
jgi:hypothetical protein